MKNISDTYLIMPFPRLRHNFLYHFISVATAYLSLLFSLITTISMSYFLLRNISQEFILYFRLYFLCMMLSPLYECKCVCNINTLVSFQGDWKRQKWCCVVHNLNHVHMKKYLLKVWVTVYFKIVIATSVWLFSSLSAFPLISSYVFVFT